MIAGRSQRLLMLILIALCASSLAAQRADLTRFVNPFIGTGGHGHTFPGATVPFGMVQLSPDTRIDNWDGSSGYHHSDNIIYGFSHTHLSGTGIPDGADILFMPRIGDPEQARMTGDAAASRFSHANEKAEPGYYSVKLDDGGILAELTASSRVGFHRYTFPKGSKATITLNLKWRDKVTDSQLNTVDYRRIEGFRRSASWAKDQTIYFAAEFSKNWSGEYIEGDPLPQQVPNSNIHKGKDIGAVYQFDVSDGSPVLIKVAISYVSIEGARRNLEAELPHWDFDKVRADAKAAWNKELSKIEVSGGTPEQTTNFYTALYHTMIHPNVFNDVDGRYKGHDGKIHRTADAPVRNDRGARKRATPQAANADEGVRVPGEGVRDPGRHYTVFSLWDTFRAAHPLYTIIDEKRTADFINTFIRIYEQGGRLPVWELWGEETDTMIGYHAVPVIADAMAKGIGGFDYEKAYAAAKHSAELDHFGLAAYKKRGYISSEDENESVSKTLEYAYDDWCIAEMARLLKARSGGGSSYDRDIEYYSGRARTFENLFDRETGFMRPKRNGGWLSPFAANEVTFNFTEGNSWVYSFFVPHDVPRLMDLYGGPKPFAAKLEELFTTKEKLTGREQPDITGLIGQYAHGNEPSHHIPYLFSYAGMPWKTQEYVRRILDDFYKNSPDGLIGNEDCGQMSAWYILSASGFYPVASGSTTYVFGTPLFPEMKYRLENGKTFTIRARNVSPTKKYIAGAKLNGSPYRKAFIDHRDILAGGTLEFVMTDKPAPDAFTEFPGARSTTRFAAVPIITGDRIFVENTKVTISSAAATSDRIFYTLDGSEPSEASTRYTSPISVSATTTIKAVAIDARGVRSKIVDAAFAKRESDWKVTRTSGHSKQYSGGGDDGLIDGLRGSTNFASGEWQGYQGKPFEAVIDLRRPTEIREVGANFLQTVRSWIWMPATITFESSQDGVTFTRMASITTDVDRKDETPQTKLFTSKLAQPVTARYVRVRAENIGKIPSWHGGAGGDPWIFVDEIVIR